MAEQVVDPNNATQEDGMSLLEHVRELRDRLFKAAIALLIGSAIGLALSQPILEFIIRPYLAATGSVLIAIAPTEALTTVFIVAVTVGAGLAMPVIVYQILAFVMPGLLPNEKKWIFLGVPFATFLFVLGAAFGWFVLMPTAIAFLTTIYPTVFKAQLTSESYIPFIMGVVFWIGVAFEMPLIVFILAKANVVNARALAKQWRYAIVIIAIIAAFITPTPDPINMSIVMAPLLVLYVFSIGMAALARRGKTTPALLDPEEKLPGK
jgi:sec-independent protein translocase protein TatC